MKNKRVDTVKKTGSGTVHHAAFCSDCDWHDAFGGLRTVASVTSAATDKESKARCFKQQAVKCA